jgi:hypothetical protein
MKGENIMSVFNCEPGFWIGMATVGSLTLAYVLVCWLIPPKKQKNVNFKPI